MERCRFLVGVALLLLASGCTDDANGGLTTTCGDGIVNNDEICDGEAFAEGVQVCPEGMVLKENAVFACTSTCGLDFSKACEVPACNGNGNGDSNGEGCTECTKAVCGNDVLDGGEVCDGEQMREDVKVCPEGMRLLDNAVWSCTDSCLVDLTQACAPTTCGDGVLDAGEACEIDANGKIVVADDAAVCAEGYTQIKNRDLLKCSACALVNDYACMAEGEKEPTLYFSEFYAQDAGDSNVSQHLYIEIGNLGAETSVEDCKIVGIKDVDQDNKVIKLDDIVFEYPLSAYQGTLGNTANDIEQVLTVCYENKAGWLANQYDETTISLESYLELVGEITKTEYLCRATCDNKTDCDDACKDACYAGCQAATQIWNKAHEQERAAVWARHVDENCDVYMPESITALQLLSAKSAYNPKEYWGIALMCGDTVHDAVSLSQLGKNGGERYCPDSKLASIVNTSTTLWTGEFYGASDDAMFDRPTWTYSSTIGYAECGQEIVN